MSTIDPAVQAPAEEPATPELPRRASEMPDEHGYFGDFGGVYVPETLIHALQELEDVYLRARRDQNFRDELDRLFKTFVGRPVPFQEARRLSGHARAISRSGKNATIWLKREDLAHTGAHKINNTLGQALLAKKMGKRRIIAETGAGQHGVATATACAHLGLKCEVYMGAEDVRRQSLNVARMRMLGATVNTVDAGSRTLKDATNEAMRDWMGSVEDTHYILGSVVGPHPFPMIVRDFQSVMGREIKAQALRHLGALPTVVVACVGGGSNAAGAFFPFVEDRDVRLIGVEAGGLDAERGHHAAPLTHGSPGVLHGSLSYVLQSDDGQTEPVHSCSAGLDYPGVGPEHAYWKDTRRVEYDAVTDDDALDAFELIAQTEGIIPALETAHAVAKAVRIAAELSAEETVVINVSGRGDKDVAEADRLLRLRDEREGEAERKAASDLRAKPKKRKKRRRG